LKSRLRISDSELGTPLFFERCDLPFDRSEFSANSFLKGFCHIDSERGGRSRLLADKDPSQGDTDEQGVVVF
jgi:hypothetical protein